MAGNLLAHQYSGKIWKFNGFSNTIADSFAVTASDGGGVVWDGTDIYWAYNITTTSYYKKGTGFSNTVQASFTDAEPPYSPYDFDLIDTDLVLVDTTKYVRRRDGFSSTISESFQGATNTRGVFWDGTDIYYTQIGTASEYRKVTQGTGFSNTVKSSIQFGSEIAFQITWDGTDMYMSNQGAKYWHLTGFSTTVSASFTPGSTGGIGIDWDNYPLITTTSSSTSSSTTTSSSTSSSTTTSSTTTSSTTTSSSSTSTTQQLPELDGLAWGEQNPTEGEQPVSWKQMSITGTIIGDADWGKLQVLTGEYGMSKVYTFASSLTRTYTLTPNKYGTGQGGAATYYIRGDTNPFAMGDVSPEWELYTVPVKKTWKYVQVRAIKS